MSAVLAAAGRELLVVFGAPRALARPGTLAALRAHHPGVPVLVASSAGEIHGPRLLDGTVVATLLRFERTTVRGVVLPVPDASRSREVGRALAAALAADDLRHVLVLSDGLWVNASELVRGLGGGLPAQVTVSGGLAGDGGRGGRTLVGFDDAPGEHQVAAVGLYGTSLRVGCASLGGWDPFGPDRVVTRAEGHVLFDIDGEPALELYRRYLGPHAAGLPDIALRFPLSLRGENGRGDVVRSILDVREHDASMVFAGEIPEGSTVRLMKTTGDRLVDGAAASAEASQIRGAAAALLVSCVGRRVILGQRTEEELEAVHDVLGAVPMLGFYSNGEIAPSAAGSPCDLHNQTMTITTFAEDV